MSKQKNNVITHAEWTAEAVRRFGKDSKLWKFKCPMCSFVAPVRLWHDLGGKDMVAYSCVGRLMERKRKRDAFDSDGKGPCNYAGGGLFRMNPVRVEQDGEIHEVFDFA